MSSKVLVPVSDFAALITRLDALEAKVAERLVDGVYKYGPCLRCGYGPWDSSSAHAPRCCPRCHSAYWDREPRRSFARTPDDPPLARWDPSRKTKARRVRTVPAVQTRVVEAPTSAAPRPAVVLPPELRPPGEPLIPPPPRVTPEPTPTLARDWPHDWDREEPTPQPPLAPTEHVAVLPEEIVQRILATGEGVTYDEIKAAKEGGDASASDTPVSEAVREAPTRPTDTSLQAKKDEFFASAIEAGLAVPAGEETPVAPAGTPFVADTEAPSLAPPADDDPFWK